MHGHSRNFIGEGVDFAFLKVIFDVVPNHAFCVNLVMFEEML